MGFLFDTDDILRALRGALGEIEIVGVPRRVPKGFSSESWRVETDRGELLVKVRRQRTDEAKLRSQLVAARLAFDVGVPTPEILFAGIADSLDARPLVIARYLPGDDAEETLPALDALQRRQFFAEFGAAIGRLHLIALPNFSERIGEPAGATDTWADAVGNTAARYATWNETIGSLDRDEIAAMRARLLRDGAAVSPVIHPRLTHRDLYLANVLLDGGRFAALLDFELAKGKDPLLDFVKLGMLVFEPHPEAIAPLLTSYRDVVGAPPLARERLRLCLGLEHLAMLPNWRQTGDSRLEDYSRRQLRGWLAGRYPAWLDRCAALLVA